MNAPVNSLPPAVGQEHSQEPLHFILRGIVALAENIIDDQDPRAIFAPEVVSEAGRTIRRTANAAITRAIQLHEASAAHEARIAALVGACEAVLPWLAPIVDGRSDQWKADKIRAALALAKGATP